MSAMLRFPAPTPLTLIGVSLLVALAGPAAAQGVAVFDAPAHDFGRLGEADVARHAFTFTNAGDAPLQLTHVEAACGCTTPSWSTDPVPPGGAGWVEVAFDPEGQAGPFERAVHVVADGAEPSAATLRISGTVVPTFVTNGVALGALTFERDRAEAVVEGGAAQASFRFANTGDRPVRIERVEATAPGVEVVFPERPVFADGTGGLFVIAEGVGPGEIGLDVHTTDAEEPVKRLVVRLLPPRPAGGE